MYYFFIICVEFTREASNREPEHTIHVHFTAQCASENQLTNKIMLQIT